jgi:hypothetical protein
MDICVLKHVFEILVAIFSLGAAGFWFGAAWVSRVSIFGDPMRLVEIAGRRQALLNGVAASCAGIAALLQLIITWMPVCRAFG